VCSSDLKKSAHKNLYAFWLHGKKHQQQKPDQK